MSDEVKIVDAEVVESPPKVTEEDILEAFRILFDEIVVLRGAVAEALRQLGDLQTKVINDRES